MTDPTVERLGGRLVQLGDELVEPGLGDEGGLGHTPAVPLNEIWGNRLTLIGIELPRVSGGASLKIEIEGTAGIRGDEPRFKKKLYAVFTTVFCFAIGWS